MSTAYRKYEIEGHAFPSEAVSDAYESKESTVGWRVEVRRDPGDPWRLLCKCKTRGNADAAAAGHRDGSLPEEVIETRVRRDICIVTMLERRTAACRERDGIPDDAGPIWSADYRDHLEMIESASEDSGLALFVDEDHGDQYGIMPSPTRVGTSLDLQIPVSENMAPAILAELRSKIDALEIAFAEAGLIQLAAKSVWHAPH